MSILANALYLWCKFSLISRVQTEKNHDKRCPHADAQQQLEDHIEYGDWATVVRVLNGLIWKMSFLY